MKVLLDEDLPHKLRLSLLGFETVTVSYLGWSGLRNGDLLAAAEAAGFEVLVTGDKKLSKQQKLEGRTLGVVCLSAQEWPIIRNHIPAIAEAIGATHPGSIRTVDCGSFQR